MSLEQQKATVIHEVAHAIVGPLSKAHGDKWRMVDKRLGGTGERCHNNMENRKNARWQGSCECGKTVGYFRKPSRKLMFKGCGHSVVFVDIKDADDKS